MRNPNAYNYSTRYSPFYMNNNDTVRVGICIADEALLDDGLPDCRFPAVTRGLCRTHYQRAYRMGIHGSYSATRDIAPAKCIVNGCRYGALSWSIYCEGHWHELEDDCDDDDD